MNTHCSALCCASLWRTVPLLECCPHLLVSCCITCHSFLPITATLSQCQTNILWCRNAKPGRCLPTKSMPDPAFRASTLPIPLPTGAPFFLGPFINARHQYTLAVPCTAHISVFAKADSHGVTCVPLQLSFCRCLPVSPCLLPRSYLISSCFMPLTLSWLHTLKLLVAFRQGLHLLGVSL